MRPAILEQKKCIKKFEKKLAKPSIFVYTMSCCDMIAKKREVATELSVGFPWSKCQEGRYSGPYEPDDKSLYRA